MEMLFCVNAHFLHCLGQSSTCKRSAWKDTFLKPGLRVEKSKNDALAFSCGQRILRLSWKMKRSIGKLVISKIVVTLWKRLKYRSCQNLTTKDRLEQNADTFRNLEWQSRNVTSAITCACQPTNQQRAAGVMHFCRLPWDLALSWILKISSKLNETYTFCSVWKSSQNITFMIF